MVKRKRVNKKWSRLVRVLLGTLGCICIYAGFTFGEWQRVHEAAAGTLSQLGVNVSRLSDIDALVTLEYLKQSAPSETIQTEEVSLSRLQPRYCPVAAWKQMMQHWNVQSVLEVGVCGSATSWFAMHNTSKTACVVPTVDSEWPKEWQIQHNFNEGPWQKHSTVKTLKSFDVGWAIDLLLNQPKNLENYLESLRATAVLVMSIPPELAGKSQEYWISTMEKSYGFQYNRDLTEELQQWALEIDRKIGILLKKDADTATALADSMVSLHVFLNPVVSAMKQHAHLFQEHGCYLGKLTKEYRMPGQSAILHRPCGSGSDKFISIESTLPVNFTPRSLSLAMDDQWGSFLHTTKPNWKVLKMSPSTAHASEYNTRKQRVLNRLEVLYEWGKNTSAPMTYSTLDDAVEKRQKQVDRLQTIIRLGSLLKSNKQYDSELPQGNSPIPIDIGKNKISNQSISVWDQVPKSYRYGKDPIPDTTIPFANFWEHVRKRAEDPSTRPEIASKLESRNYTDSLPLPILIWPMHKIGIETAEHHHLFDEGTKQSKYLNMVTDESNFHPNLLWIADPGKGESLSFHA